MVGLDGSGRRKLVEGRKPSWAPDGKHIAYCAAKKPGEHVYYTPAVYSVETGKSECFNEFSTCGPFSRILWTADGRGIVFPVRKPASVKGDIGYPWWVFLPLESRPARTIEIVPIHESLSKADPPLLWDFSFGMQGAAFAWATRALVKSGSDSLLQVETIGIRYGVPTGDDAAAVTPAMLSKGGFLGRDGAGPRHPVWHPREPVLLFDAFGCVWKMDVLQRTVSLFWPKEGTSSLNGAAALPSFSPDGNSVAFVLEGDEGHCSVACVDDSGAQEHVVSRDIVHPPRTVGAGPTPFVWGPDGDCLVFAGETGELTVARRREQSCDRWPIRHRPAGVTPPHEVMPTEQDVKRAEEVLRREARSWTLSDTVRVEFELMEPYIRTRLLTEIRECDYYHAYYELVSLPSVPAALDYFKEAARSRDPLLRAVGLGGLCRVDKANAAHHVKQGLSDAHEWVRCEAIAALISVEGRRGVRRLKPLSQWKGIVEKCEAAAALIRLGDATAKEALEESFTELRSELPSLRLRFPSYDYRLWMYRREDYYALVLESAGSEIGRKARPDTALESFVPAVHAFGEPYDYLRPGLSRDLSDPKPDVRAQAVRCLGRIPTPWATELLKTRLRDEANCVLNGGGYGWSASVACLSAICLLERGDRSGVEVLRQWVRRHQVLLKQGKLYPPEYAATGEWGADEYAGLRDVAPAIALVRAGDREPVDLLRFRVREHMTRGVADLWESSPAWETYHLALLGEQEALDVLRRMLGDPPHTGFYQWSREAAGCILALAREPGAVSVFAPSIDAAGPVCYPDCWRK